MEAERNPNSEENLQVVTSCQLRRAERRGRPGWPEADEAASTTSTREWSALLTASEFGKMAATSGSSTTMLELSLTRAWYFPRSSLLKSERLYSRRSSSDLDLAFLINLRFAAGSKPGTDDANRFVPVCMCHNQEPTGRRAPKCDQPFLIFIFGSLTAGSGTWRAAAEFRGTATPA